MLTWSPSTQNAEQAARDILSAATFFHSTFKDEVWLWRGQARGSYGFEPGMHTRVLNSDPAWRSEAAVRLGTQHLLKVARAAGLDRSDDVRLPDLALLATLQHHGAATALLDVTTDPLIALWMVAFANAAEPHGLDGVPGKLFAILRPTDDRWIKPLDARPYSSEAEPSVAETVEDTYAWYQAPDVTERLRIQRGSFIIGGLNTAPARSDTSLFLDLGAEEFNEDGKNFVERRIAKRGQTSNTAWRRSELFAIHVRASVKKELRKLLSERSGLSVRAVYPTPWHKPFIEQFSESYGRARPLSFDLDGSWLP